MPSHGDARNRVHRRTTRELEGTSGNHDDGELRCAICGEDHPFDLPDELLDAALEGQLVVFAGAGVSTESRRALGDTFALRIAQELGIPPRSLPFPEVMTEFEARFGRRELLQRIRSRFDYIRTFSELQQAATRFHRELSTAYFLSVIVTTNWDTYFEDYAASTPIVTPADYAFWDLPGRRVFKLHGSMHNLGTLVVTASDYEQCYRRLRIGTIGASLKHLLATRQIVFVGYSFGDSDLARILAFVKRELGSVVPNAYVVSPHGYDGKEFPVSRVIKTDGAYFIRQLKEAAIARGVMRPDLVYDVVDSLGYRVAEARYRAVTRFRPAKHPAVIYTWAYQDGVLHAVDRILAFKSSGYYSNPVSLQPTLHTYEHARRGALARRNYWDAAYIQGYQNGLLAIALDPDVALATPLYLLWGSRSEMLSFPEFASELRHAADLNRTATERARKIVAAAGGFDPIHTPFLDVQGLARADPRRES